MLYICLSADHELFLKKNYVCGNDVLIKPTYDFLNILKNHNVKATLFTDVFSIIKLKENTDSEFPLQIETQLKFAVKNGHDVQLHIHPHWLVAKQKNHEWYFEQKYYSLHGFSDKKPNIDEIIKLGKDYLTNLLKPIKLNYNCIAYRAGGYCIQPETEILKYLIKNNIKIDSSIIKNAFCTNSETHFFDFRNLPNKINWFFNEYTGIKNESSDHTNSLLEVPIGSLDSYLNFFNFCKLYLRQKFIKKKILPKGISIQDDKSNFFYKVFRRFTTPISLNFDSNDSKMNIKILCKYLKNLKEDKKHIISLNCHPKTFTSIHLNEISNFLKKVYSLKLPVTFITFSEIEQTFV